MAEPWEPASTDVAAHLQAFTRDAQGARGDFTADTKVTLAEVQRAISSVVGDVIAAAGPIRDVDLDPTVADGLTLYDLAKSVAAIGAAAEAVIDADRELHNELQDLYESRLARLVTAATDARDGHVDGKVSPPPTWRGPAPFNVSRRSF